MDKAKDTIAAMITVVFIMLIGFSSFGIKLHKASQEIEVLQRELDTNQTLLQSKTDELIIAQENLRIETEKSIGLSEVLEDTNKELETINAKLEEANIIIADLKSEEYELIYIGEFKLTHYCTEQRPHICGTGAGITATGTQVAAGRTIAVDPTVIPYGTEVYIEGYGWRVAEDCGGAVNGNHIDIAVENHNDALSIGTTSGGVWIIVKLNS